MPHGGFNESGYGKDMSLYSMEEYTRIKHVCVKLAVSRAQRCGTRGHAARRGGRRARPRGDRLHGVARDRSLVDRTRLLARRRDRDGDRDRGRPGARRDARLVRADVPDRGRVLLPEPRRSGRRHDVLVGDADARSVGRLDRRVGDLHDRHSRDRLAGGRRRALLLRPRRLGLGRRVEVGRDRPRRGDHRRDDRDLHPGDGALGAAADGDDAGAGRDPARLRLRRARQGLLRRRAGRLVPAAGGLALAVRDRRASRHSSPLSSSGSSSTGAGRARSTSPRRHATAAGLPGSPRSRAPSSSSSRTCSSRPP